MLMITLLKLHYHQHLQGSIGIEWLTLISNRLMISSLKVLRVLGKDTMWLLTHQFFSKRNTSLPRDPGVLKCRAPCTIMYGLKIKMIIVPQFHDKRVHAHLMYYVFHSSVCFPQYIIIIFMNTIKAYKI
ncbi:hypothetical protein QJS10_CPB19g01400 [Acorus calamus]|uniref:Uncharacterized protein n=1 Tax=Acorus calamus TaxID=4465 RepID=A0AAV9CGL1_ACOCL|nr:hypothetical protein QJS10_CPB19g01400 [Acorus calamus]